jgi:hypothetical protein
MKRRLVAFAIVASVLVATFPIATVGGYTGTQVVVGSLHTDFGTGTESAPNTLNDGLKVSGSGDSADIRHILEAKYPFEDDGTTGTATDVWGPHDLSIDGGASYSMFADVGSRSMKFDGTSSAQLSGPTPDVFGNNNWTTAFSVNLNDTSNLQDITSYADGSFNTWWRIRFTDLDSDGFDDLRVRFDDGTNTRAIDVTDTALADGGWHHLTVRHIEGSGYELFVDGTSVGTASDGGDLTNSGADLYLGDSPSNNPTTGNIDEYKVFRSALSDSQVSILNSNRGKTFIDGERYISANHSVGNAAEAWGNVTLQNAHIDYRWEYDDGSSWAVGASGTWSTTGNHSVSLPDVNSETWRLNTTFVNESGDTTAKFHDEGVKFTNHSPTVDNNSASPTGDLSTSSITLSIDANDTEFPLPQGDSVTAEFFVKPPDSSSFSSVGTDTITSNGTVSVSYSASTGGTYDWKVELTDSYGGEQNSSTFSFKTPVSINIRNVTEPHAKLTSPVTAEIVIAGSNQTVDKRTVSNGEISLQGLDTTESYVIYVTTSNYYSRSIYLNNLYDQQTIFMLNKSVTGAENTFDLTDNTGRFNDRPKLVIQRIINRSLYDSSEPKRYQWTAVAGDRLGAVSAIEITLQQNARYRLVVKNVDGDTRSLGEYVAKSNGTVPLTIGTITWEAPNENGFSVNADQVNQSGSPYAKFQYSDPSGNTSELTLRIHERGNVSNEIFRVTEQNLGNYSETVALPHTDHVWVANYTVDRNGETFNGSSSIGAVDNLPLPVPEKWLTPAIYIGLIAVLSMTPKASARTGALAVSGLGAMVWAFGWAPISGPAIGIAGAIAILGKAGDYAEKM